MLQDGFSSPDSGRVSRPPACVTVDQTNASLSIFAGKTSRPCCTGTRLPVPTAVVADDESFPHDDGSETPPGNSFWVLMMLSRARCSDVTLLFGLSEWWLPGDVAILVRSGATCNSATVTWRHKIIVEIPIQQIDELAYSFVHCHL
jgi:hypothetical protein